LKIVEFFKKRKKGFGLLLVGGVLILICAGLLLESDNKELVEPDNKKKNWGTHQTKFDKELGWTHIPNHTFVQGGIRYSTNSLGFRSPELDPSKKKILLVGDSVAYGGFVEQDETMAHYLEKKLDGHQVLNLSVPGYGVDQYYFRIKKHIASLKPKLVIVVIGTGQDLYDTSQAKTNFAKPYFKVDQSKVEWSKIGDAELDSSNVILINDHVSRFSCENLFSKFSSLVKFSGLDRLEEYFCPSRGVNPVEIHYVLRAILLKFKELAEEYGTQLFFILSPDFFELDNVEIDKSLMDSFFEGLPASIIPKNFKRKPEPLMWRTYMKELKLEHLDFFDVMMQKNFNSKELFVDNYHYSPLGNQRLATAVYSRIKERL